MRTPWFSVLVGRFQTAQIKTKTFLQTVSAPTSQTIQKLLRARLWRDVYPWPRQFSRAVAKFLRQATKRHLLEPFSGLLMIAAFVVIGNQANQQALAAPPVWQSTAAGVPPEQVGRVLTALDPLTPELTENPQRIASALLASDEVYLSHPELASMTKAESLSKKDPIQYIVQTGDTVTGIAAAYGLHVASILAVNELQPTQLAQIKPGDQLTIPTQDISSSTDWLVAIQQYEEQQRAAQVAQQKAQSRNKLARAATTVVRSASSLVQDVIGRADGHSGTYAYGYCTDGVATWRPDLPSDLGNAKTWVARARAEGLSTGSEPRVGAVVQTRESYYGHVALVTSVTGDTITIRERNYRGWNIDSTRTLSVNDPAIVDYIY